MRYSDPFLRLKTSRFRRGFRLTESEKNTVYEYGLEEVKQHAYKFVIDHLMKPSNDGHQTPYKGHPVFKAMHATATCCRRCLFKWHRIPRYRELEDHEVEHIVGLIMRWISAKTVL